MNLWNHIHRSIRRTYFGAIAFFVCLIGVAIAAPGPAPAWLLRPAGILLLAFCASSPLLHLLEIHARRNMDPAPLLNAEVACGFCGRAPSQLETLMAGPEKHICAGCIQDACVLVQPQDGVAASAAALRCSFWLKDRPVGTVLLRGSAAICGDCARLAATGLRA